MCAFLVVNGDTKSEEIADNLYECTLCGACTNNCMTGFDPKVFIQELKTEKETAEHRAAELDAELERIRNRNLWQRIFDK